MRKKFIVLIFLLNMIVFPITLNAELPDNLNVTTYNKLADFQVYDKYTYYSADENQRDYITSERIKELQNEGYTVTEIGTRAYYYYRYKASPIALIYNRTYYKVSGVTSYGSTDSEAKNSSMEKMIGKKAYKCKDSACNEIYGSTVYMTITSTILNRSSFTWTVTTGDTKNSRYANSSDVAKYSNSAPSGAGWTKTLTKYKVNASWSKSSRKSATGELNVPQYSHKTDTGITAYCLQAGAKFTSQKYIKAEDYSSKIKNCKKTNDSYYCKLAAAVVEANKNYGGDELTTLTALRLLTAQAAQEFGEASFIDYASGSYAVGSKYYTNTVNALGSYNGSTSNPGQGILYSRNNLSALQNAISIYRYVNASNDIFKIDAKFLSQRYDVNDGNAWFIIETNFEENSGTQITNVSLSNGMKVSDFTYYPNKSNCENNNVNGTCIKIVVPMSQAEFTTFGALASFSYTSPYKDIINQMALYYPVQYTNNYQRMFIFDGKSPFEVPINGGKKCSSATDNGTTKYYGLNGEEVDENTFKNMCRCVDLGDNNYLDRNGKEVGYDDYSTSCRCTTPYENGTDHYINIELTPTDYTGWSNSCPCGYVYIDGQTYYYNTDGRLTTENDWQETCTEDITCPPELKIVQDKVPDTCDKTSEGTIEDPAMCTILSDNSLKSSYQRLRSAYEAGGMEGSTKYEQTYCTIYCRETIKFTFMDKEKALAGRTFIYDVQSKYGASEKLSTVILSEKQCTSIINYDTWLTDYNAASAEVLNSWNDLKDKETVYNNRSGYSSEGIECSDSEGGSCCESHYESATCTDDDGNDYECGGDVCDRYDSSDSCEVSSQRWHWSDGYSGYWPYGFTDSNGTVSIADAYSVAIGEVCCGCSACEASCSCTVCEEASAGLSTIETNYRNAVSRYETAVIKRDKLLNQLQDCNFMQDNGTENKKVYSKNEYYVTSESSTLKTFNTLKNFNAFTSDYKTSDTLYVDYEENTTYNEDYKIGDNTGNEPKEYAKNVVSKFDSISFSASGEYDELCNSCTGDLSAGSTSYITSTSNNTNAYDDPDVYYWECTGSETSAECHKMEDFTIPKNKMVSIIVDNESRYYQDSKLYTQLYTGKISLESDLPSRSYINGWRKLDDYSYPVSAYRKTGEYTITLTYKNLWEKNRLTNISTNSGNYTCVYQVENALTNYDCTPTYGHKCYECYGSNCSTPDSNNTYFGAYYRNIDLTDVFPNSQYSKYKEQVSTINRRDIGFNWINESGVIREIQENGDDIILNKEPRYIVKLSSSDITNIKRYNKTTDYLDNSLECNANTFRCTSNFLTNRNSYNSFGSTGYPLIYGTDINANGVNIVYNPPASDGYYYYTGR